MGGIIQLLRSLGVLPPHEFAYGAQLKAVGEIPAQVDRILSLRFMDPKKTRIQVSTLGKSGGLGELISLCSQARGENPSLDSLASSIKQISKKPAPAQISRFLDLLIQYQDVLKDETKQDEIIVFVHYGLKDPAALDPSVGAAIAERVRKLDTAGQYRDFVSRRCPRRYLAGTINIYPHFVENTSWYKSLEGEDSQEVQPILEIRFMGLRGVFDYMLKEIQATLGLGFFHLDGEALPAD